MYLTTARGSTHHFSTFSDWLGVVKTIRKFTTGFYYAKYFKYDTIILSNIQHFYTTIFYVYVFYVKKILQINALTRIHSLSFDMSMKITAKLTDRLVV